MARNSGRSEKRIALAVPLWLSSLRRPGILEKALTANVSTKGARVISAESWDADEEIAVLCPPVGSTQAKIVYTQRLISGERDQFALGIHLQSPMEGWPVGRSQTS